MSASGYILILVMLLLGAGIAALGDRIGSRVGKARLTLFKMRPRKTALLVTIFTGSLISASTLGILFAANEQLRTGVFQLKRIQNRLSDTQREVNEARGQRDTLRQERDAARNEIETAQERLSQINRSLKMATARQAKTQAQLKATQNRLQATQNRLGVVSQQAGMLRRDIQTLQADRKTLIQQRDRVAVERDRAIAEKQERLQALEQERAVLEQERAVLDREVQRLYDSIEKFRTQGVAILRNQPLILGVVRISDPRIALQAVDKLLQDANHVASELTQPGTNNSQKRVVQITGAQVQQLIEQINDGREYVVRILSASNYFRGEDRVQVFAVVDLNQRIFQAGEKIAPLKLESPATLPEPEIRQRLELLVSAAHFRARRAGMLSNETTIGSGSSANYARFLEGLMQYDTPLELRAIATEDIFTAGPLKIDLIAIQAGQVVLSTKGL